MADVNLHLRQNVSPLVLQRMVLVGRVKMAQAIKLPESEWAKMLSEVEKDPVFQELMAARSEGRKIIRFKRFGQTGLSGQFYESQDANVVGGGGETPESLLDQKKHLLTLIEKVGQEKFERFFLFREEGDTLENIASQCAVSVEEAKELQDFVLDMSVQTEFYHPSSLQTSALARPTLVGRIVANTDGTFSIAFFSPHLARGMYEIDRDALRRWQKSKKLDRQAAARLRRYIGVLELSNLKQGAFWRVIDHLLRVQKNYFKTQDPTKMMAVSLRKVAKELQFAPSTISRVMSLKSVLLPWDREILITDLMPGQRKVVLHILDKMMGESHKHPTDFELSRKIAESYGVKVSRRTITACRHALRTLKNPSQNAA
jgi:DNA-directed RNA polymerase specialized sigma54-like protein